MTSHPPIRVHVDSGTVTFTIDRPDQHNALTEAMWRHLAREVTRRSSDESVRVLVFRGAGERAFSAGADIKEFQSRAAEPGWINAYTDAVGAAEEAIAAAPQPTIAMIRGHCVGGGCAIAVACDIRLAAEESRFAIPVAKMGLVYSLPATRRLMELVGPADAKYLLFSARSISAGDAYQMGLLNRVVRAEDLLDETHDLAAAIAAGSAHTVRSAKEIARRVLMGQHDDDAATAELQAAGGSSAHYHKAIASFTENRARVSEVSQ
jgi:enoyl-CoA hydratase/carnithine racemase